MDLDSKIRLFSKRFAGNRLAQEWFDKKTQKKMWAPFCHNTFDFKKGCRKGRAPQPCKDCEAADFQSWTPETVKAHIFGSNIDPNTRKPKGHGVYLLQPDGMISFGAIDFDSAHTFLDVIDFYEAALSYGLQGHIATSTTKGWHIYYFFSEPVKAIKFRSVMLQIFDDFDWAVLPELFPKQSRTSDFGNLIKPPMTHPNMKSLRNCFVTASGTPIGKDPVEGVLIESQWDYLLNAKLISSMELDDAIEVNAIPIRENQSSPYISTKKDTPWKPPVNGDFIKVIENCATIKKLVLNPLAPDVTHEQRVALAVIAVNCKNGIQHLRSIFPARNGDWKNDEAIDSFGDLKGSPHIENMIEQAKNYNYKPWTCSKLKACGACTKKGNCLEKRVRMQTIEGKLVPMDGEFVEPSPYRFAIDNKTVVSYDDIISIAKSCKGLDMDEVIKTFRQNLPHITSFKKAQIDIAIEAFKKYGKVKLSILKGAFREYLGESCAKRDDSLNFNGAVYRMDYDNYKMIKIASKKDDVAVVEFANFLAKITEIRRLTACEGEEEVVYHGYMEKKDRKIKFAILQEDWHNRRKLPQLLGQISMGDCILLERHAEDFLISVREFSEYKVRSILTSFGYYGEMKDVYCTPSVIIDKDGIRPNNKEQDMDLSMGHLSKAADFTHLDVEEFRETAKFFWDELSTFLPKQSTLPVMAYYFLMPIFGRFSKQSVEKPALWLQGSPGTGKTTLARIMNSLFGDYYKLSMKNSWTSSYNHICKEGMYMKDLPYLVDDYRKNVVSEKLPEQVINNYYDEVGRGTLRRDSGFNSQRIIKGFLVATGEEVPKDGGSISRCIVVNFNPVKPNTPKLRKIESRVDSFRGIMPYYIHYLYQFENSDFVNRIADMQKYFQNLNGGFCEARILKSASMLALGAAKFVEFMAEYQLFTEQEAEKILGEFVDAISTEILETSRETQNNQGAAQFVDALAELISTNSVRIDGYNNEDTNNRPTVGFILQDNGHPVDEFVYISYRTAIGKVSTFLKEMGEKLTHSERTITQQLKAMSLLIDPGTNGHVRKTHGGQRLRVWKFHKNTLGLRDKLRIMEADYPVEEPKDAPFGL